MTSAALPENDGAGGVNIQLALATLLLVISFVVFTFGTVPQLTFPYALNYGEGVLLDQARRVTEPAGLYPSFDEAPFVIDNYPPVYPMLVALLPDVDGAPFFMARLVSLLSTLVAASMLALLIRRWSGDLPALLGAALFLSLPQINDFAEFARIDSLALALGLTGMYCILRDDRALWRWLGCAAFFLSIYTRHSSLALPLATFVILFQSEGRKMLVWPFGLLAAGGAAYFGMHLWTDGRIYDHLIHFNVLDYSWMQQPLERIPPGTFEKWFGGVYPLGYLLVFAAFLALLPITSAGKLRWNPATSCVAILGAVAVLFFLYVLGKSISAGTWGVPSTHFLEGGKYVAGWNLYYNLAAVHGLLGLAALCSLRSWWRVGGAPLGVLILLGFASAAMIGRTGSDTNYLFEASVALTVATAFAVHRGPVWLRSVAAALLVAAVCSNIYVLEWSDGGEGGRDSRPRRLKELARSQSKILKELQKYDGPILSDNPAFPAILGKAMVYQPFMYRQLAEAQQWDPHRLHEALRAQEFDAVVISAISALKDPANPKAGVAWVAAQDTYLTETRERWIKPFYEPTDVKSFDMITPVTVRRWEVWRRKAR